MRLYQHPMSSNSRRVVMTALLIGQPLDLVEVSLMNEQDRKLLGEINPNNKLPVLEDEGFLLWESQAIMQYLCDKQGGHPAYPADLRQRAEVNRWMFWSAQHWSPNLSYLTYQHFIKGMLGRGEPDPAEVARCTLELERFAPVLDARLAGRAWVAGEQPTLADLSLAAPLMYMEQGKLPLGSYVNIQNWFKRVQEQDFWQKTSKIF